MIDRMGHIDGVNYGAFIVPGLFCCLFSQALIVECQLLLYLP